MATPDLKVSAKRFIEACGLSLPEKKELLSRLDAGEAPQQVWDDAKQKSGQLSYGTKLQRKGHTK